MTINVDCEFDSRGSIPSLCQITDVDLEQVNNFCSIAHLRKWSLLASCKLTIDPKKEIYILSFLTIFSELYSPLIIALPNENSSSYKLIGIMIGVVGIGVIIGS